MPRLPTQKIYAFSYSCSPFDRPVYKTHSQNAESPLNKKQTAETIVLRRIISGVSGGDIDLKAPQFHIKYTTYYRNKQLCKHARRCQDFVEFFSDIAHERISDFLVKCGYGHPASPRRRQSDASLAEIEWRRELRHHRFNMPSDSTPAVLQFPCAFPAVIACCPCGKA